MAIQWETNGMNRKVCRDRQFLVVLTMEVQDFNAGQAQNLK